jgi:hypothetical protein
MDASPVDAQWLRSVSKVAAVSRSAAPSAHDCASRERNSAVRFSNAAGCAGAGCEAAAVVESWLSVMAPVSAGGSGLVPPKSGRD